MINQNIRTKLNLSTIYPGIKTSIGCTDININGKKIIITHRGNMRTGINKVNENLKYITEIDNTIDFLKNSEYIKEYKEKGSPDYYYKIVFETK